MQQRYPLQARETPANEQTVCRVMASVAGSAVLGMIATLAGAHRSNKTSNPPGHILLRRRVSRLPVPPEKRPESVDWENEAHVVAGDVVANIAGNEARKCLDVPEPGSWLPPCSQRAINMPESKGKEWISFPIGFSYIGLNVRVGKLKPDGHVFDDMRSVATMRYLFRSLRRWMASLR